MPHGVYDKIICETDKHPPFTPQEHQEQLLDYFLNKLKYKGVLAFHRLGSGKSCSSIMIADEMLKQAKAKKVYVLTPGSLRQNFIEEYCYKCGYKPKYLKKYYTFITYNYSVGNRLPNFNNSLVIIDEVHNLINGVKNQSKHTTLIYKALLNSDCKILALSGTPIFNFIWEWPFLGNLLKPGAFPKMIKGGTINPEEFMIKFNIDSNGKIIPKNPALFKIKLRGIISYFPGRAGGYYPEVIHEPPIQVRMTIEQDKHYWPIDEWERKTRGRGPPKKSILKKNPVVYYKEMEQFIMASKYIMSRMYSNFYYPERFRSSSDPKTKDEVSHIGKVTTYTYKPLGKTYYSKKDLENGLREEFSGLNKKKIDDLIKKNVEKDVELVNIGWVDKRNFDGFKLNDVYSRKIVALITNVLLNWKAKHVVFTYFKTKAGVNLLHAVFKMCGIKTAIFSGDISDSKRKSILNRFNSEKNRYGDRVKLLLVTEAGAEGINILEAQHMHILESSTREMKIQQAIGRVVRYRSHMVEGRKPMPKKEQVVHIWRYWSTSNPDPFTIKSDKKGDKKEVIITDKTTVDETLYKNGLFSVNSMQSFLNLLKKSSVTPYDKGVDKDSMMKDFGLRPVPPEMIKAYEISDKRYLDDDDKKEIDVDEILRYGTDVTDEDK